MIHLRCGYGSFYVWHERQATSHLFTTNVRANGANWQSNQAAIDADGVDKLKVSVLIGKISKRARRKISEEPMPGKAGMNARAVRFVRIVATRNQQLGGEPLNMATAAAANAIFGTSYRESDIRNLLNR